MKLHRLLIVLTVINFGLLVFLLAQMRPVAAQDTAPVLRTQKLEIVDGQGTVRGDIRVDEPEAITFRLFDPSGRIRVKLGATPDGSGLNLFNNTQEPGILMSARRAASGGSGITW